MPKLDLDHITRSFFNNLIEGKDHEAGIREYVQALGETINSFNPRTQMEQRRVTIAKQQLKEIRRQTRKLQERVAILEEQVSILEESKES